MALLPRSRGGCTRCAVERMVSSVSHALVMIMVPLLRSTSSDSPMQPSISCTAGMTSSRTMAMPSSMRCGSRRMVVLRAYIRTTSSSPAVPGRLRRTSYSPRTGTAANPAPVLRRAAEGRRGGRHPATPSRPPCVAAVGAPDEPARGQQARGGQAADPPG